VSEIQAIRDFYGEVGPAPSEPLWREFDRRVSTSGSTSIRARWKSRRGRQLSAVVVAAVAVAVILAFLPGSRHAHLNSVAPGNASAATVLRRAAARIARLPDLQPGEFLYSRGVRTTITSVDPAEGRPFSFWMRQHEELWVSVEGTFRDHWVSDPAPAGYPTEADRAAAAADPDRSDLTSPATDTTTDSPQAFEQDFGMTVAEMRALPPDPEKLAARLQELGRRWKAANPTDPLRDDPFRLAVSVLVGPSQPGVKAALLDALARLRDVRRLPDERLNGEEVFAIAARFTATGLNPVDKFDHVLLLDPATGQLRGARYVSVGPFGNLPPGTITSRWTWRQAIVKTLGHRPAVP
jgi:hypothetical protein